MCDGQGLYLVVQPTGTRSWVQRLVIRGRKRELGLGSTALVSLAEARERALSNRKLAREGGDPLAEKRRIAAAVREHVWPHVAAGRLRPVVHATFGFAEAAAAHRLLESSAHIGKLLLVP